MCNKGISSLWFFQESSLTYSNQLNKRVWKQIYNFLLSTQIIAATTVNKVINKIN